MRIGVLGGTFDPPHIGHLVAAEEARVQLGLARVVFVPAGTPPHKLNVSITAATHRVEMLRRATASNPYFFVSLIDVERAGPSYSVDMLRQLRDEWGAKAQVFFIVGLDMLADLPAWHEPQRLIRLCRLAVVNRPGYVVDLAALEEVIPGVSEKIDYVSMPLLDVSATDLRWRVRNGRPIRYFVPAQVEAYIQAHRLYV